MQNNLEQQLSKLVEKAINVAETTGEFVIEQTPNLLQEFYAWHIAENILFLITGFLFLIPPFIVYKKWNILKKHDIEEFIVLVTGLLSATGIILFFISLINLIKITVAPKLYLIEYFIK